MAAAKINRWGCPLPRVRWMPPTPERPLFPSRALNHWLGVFSAAVALVTVWVLPIGLMSQVLATGLFVLVPLVVLAFWLGQATERRAQGRNEVRAKARAVVQGPLPTRWPGQSIRPRGTESPAPLVLTIPARPGEFSDQVSCHARAATLGRMEITPPHLLPVHLCSWAVAAISSLAGSGSGQGAPRARTARHRPGHAIR